MNGGAQLAIRLNGSCEKDDVFQDTNIGMNDEFDDHDEDDEGEEPFRRLLRYLGYLMERFCLSIACSIMYMIPHVLRTNTQT